MSAVLRPVNDNHPFGAEFKDLPEAFLLAYQGELMGWARDLQARGPFLVLDLWDPPGSTMLSSGYQGKVKLRCDALAHPVTKVVKFVIQPDSEEDVARVRKHCEELPAILRAHRAAAEANKGKARGAVRAVFNVPEYFVERYGLELREWGRNLKKIGLRKHIVLREGTLSDLSPNEELGAVLIRVELKAEIERMGNDELQLVIGPADEEQERLIRKHCEKLQRNKVPARAQLVEPERPFMPFLPTVDK